MDGLTLNNVTFRSAAADGCYGVYEGQDQVSSDVLGWSVNYLGLFGGGWGAFVRDSGDAGTLSGYLGLDWTLSAENDESTGTWTLTIADPADPSLPVTVDVLAVLKGQNNWAAYLFGAETFSFIGDSEGTFAITFKDNDGKFSTLEHMTLYLRVQQGSLRVQQVPEPGSLALLGLGLAGLALQRRRRMR